MRSVVLSLVFALALAAACSGPSDKLGDAGPDAMTMSDDGGGMDVQSDSPQAQKYLPPNPPDTVSNCMRPAIPPAQSGLCDVTAGTKGKLLRGTVLLEHEVLHTGEVLIDDGGSIVCAACDCSSSPDYVNATVVACADGVISPGLINAHDHITFANNPPKPHGMERYDQRHDWRLGLRGHTRISTSGGASANVVLYAELRFLMSGATSTISSGGRPGLLRNIDQADPIYDLGAPVQQADFDTFPLNDSAGIQHESGCTYGANPTLTSDIVADEGYLPHIAEGVDKTALNEFTCTSTGNQDLMQRQTAVIHSIALLPDQAALMRKRQTMVVWSPRSNVDLYGDTAPVTLLDAEGVPIALGTDWTPSGSMNLSRELRCADDLNTQYFAKHFSDGDLFRMVTIHGAYAAGAQRVLGSLAKGKLADVTIFDGSKSKDQRAVVDAGVEDVALVLRGGAPMYGDKPILDALGAQSCDSLGDVCGKTKSTCVTADTGVQLAAIRAAGQSVYPLYFCKGMTPTQEPSCVPYRTTYPMGITMGDKDGDGIGDATDLCPDVFDAIRPMDGMKQADQDADGIGDACDICPHDGSNQCTRPSADDIDADGVADWKDVCPETADPQQADADQDGHGDLCDACALPNPGATPCAATITQIRDPMAMNHLPDKSIVSIPAAYVTGTGSGIFFLQDSSLNPYTGIEIKQGTKLSPARGNQVAVEGVTLTLFGLVTIIPSKLTVTDSGTTLPFSPIVVSTTDVKTGGSKAASHQSMLIEVDTLTISNDIPDGATNKFYEFVVNNDVRIDDTLFLRYGGPANGPYPPNGFTNNTTFQKIQGILGFSFSNSKIWPRDTVDIVR
jgi:hypothetical protein